MIKVNNKDVDKSCMKFQKKHKPVTKNIWKLLKFMPPSLRKKVVRSQFEINYDLSSDYVFKQAETEDEIEQALNIVYESYTLLGYIDQRPERMHFNAYLCLPTTAILIIKHKDEVVGTLSIVSDSSLGLPSESTWDLSKIREKSMRLAEISSLSIKKSHKSSKGHLLLTLCKLMYEYCVKNLELDGIIIAATLEVEPFYTDLLMFKTVVSKTGQEHQAVKGNKSTCCFLDFAKARDQYKKEYAKKRVSRNFYHFFINFISPNIKLPYKNFSIHGMLHAKNMAMVKVLEKFPALKEKFTNSDKLKLANMDPTLKFENVFNLDKSLSSRVFPRISVKKFEVILFQIETKRKFKAQLVDVSYQGYGIKSLDKNIDIQDGEKCILLFTSPDESFSIYSYIQWKKDTLLGFKVTEQSHKEWQIFIKNIFEEIGISVNMNRNISDKESA